MSGLRVGFMGTPDFALEALKAIDQSAHDIAVVYSQPPRPKGRGHQVQPSPVHAYAESKNIPVYNPLSLKDENAQQNFAAHNLDIAIVAAYGLLLPKAVLEAPQYGCLNIHASILPRWRGASPIQQAIWHGDSETGISIMQMDEGLDTGPVISIESVAISSETTASSLHDQLAALGGRMVVDTLDQLAANGALPATPQNDDQKTYAPLLKKEDGRVEWSKTAQEIDQQIRALTPWPGVFAELDDRRVKILSAAVSDESSQKKPGTILNRSGDIACGEGSVLNLTKVQPHGSKAMDFSSAVNGGHVNVGECFS